MEGTIAQVLMFAGNFAPKSWAFCNGQTLAIANNTALFSLIGTMYGGDGRTTFQLPNLQGRVAIGAGQGPGLPSYVVGQQGGIESTTLTQSQLPTHTHGVTGGIAVSEQNGNSEEVASNLFANTATPNYVSGAGANGSLAGVNAVAAPIGGASPVSVLQPFLGLNYIICMYGVFPYRN